MAKLAKTSTATELMWGQPCYGGTSTQLVSKPLTLEALNQMVFVHGRPKQEVLGGIALGVAVAATTLGVFNQAKIDALKTELFKVKENTSQLFEVIQDFSMNMLALETGFNELRTTLLYQVMFNPTLFDSSLSQLENQLWSRLQ
jgi:hypothetical protein